MQFIKLDDLPALLTTSTVVLYPTDTIYGLGGFVTPEVVEKIKKIKQRPSDKPFSIIAPSFDRIHDYFAVSNTFSEERTEWKNQFHERGLTLLVPLRTKRNHEIDFSLISPTPIIGIRFLEHPFQQIISQIGKPFITTSANISGQPNITHPDQLLDTQKQLIDFCIDEGTIDRPASVIIDYSTKDIIRM